MQYQESRMLVVSDTGSHGVVLYRDGEPVKAVVCENYPDALSTQFTMSRVGVYQREPLVLRSDEAQGFLLGIGQR